MLKAWNVILVTITFLLTILGTFLTRSGVLWSIHAFANGPLGSYFLSYLIVAVLFSVVVIAWRFDRLRADRQFEAVVSKESAFLLNNVLFLGSAFAVLWGTVFPLVSEALTGHKMLVDSPFYNSVNLPLAVCILILMGVGPLVAWRRAAVKSIAGVVVYPLVVSVGVGLAMSGILRFSYQRVSVLGTLGLIAAVFAALTVFLEFYRSVTARVALTREPAWRSLLALVRNNRRKYGGYLVHLAVALIAVGIAGSGAFNVSKQQALAPGETATVGGYQLTFRGMGVSDVPGGRNMYANLVVERGDHTLGLLRPSATFYQNGQSPSTNVALYSRPLRDLYVVILGTVDGNKAVFDMHVNPLVEWIWYGGYLFIVGTLVSLWPEGRRTSSTWRTADHPVDQVYQQLAELEYDFRMGKLDPGEYERTRTELRVRLQEAEDTSQQIRRQVLDEVEQAVQAARGRSPGGSGS